jgi:hypothetical protein
LQQLARERIREAKTLLAAKCWSGAYYLAGYAVECGLKACIVAHLMKTDRFPERKFSEQCWTHNLAQLLGLTGLQGIFDAECAATPEFANNWETVREWDESSRYVRTTKADAWDLFNAITDKKHGVLTWIKAHW